MAFELNDRRVGLWSLVILVVLLVLWHAEAWFSLGFDLGFADLSIIWLGVVIGAILLTSVLLTYIGKETFRVKEDATFMNLNVWILIIVLFVVLFLLHWFWFAPGKL